MTIYAFVPRAGFEPAISVRGIRNHTRAATNLTKADDIQCTVNNTKMGYFAATVFILQL
jgi:hypothetical protein